MGALVFGLTGGIGSGKSSVAKVFREEGVPVVDADQLAREAVSVGSAAFQQIVAEFGFGVTNSEGHLDRKALGEIVFNDSCARERLNAIVHPEVKRLAEARFEELEAQGETLIAYESPLLFETNQQDKYRPIVVVNTTNENQLARIMERDGWTTQQARARVDGQLPLSEKVRRADWVIENNGDVHQLRKGSLEILGRIQEARTSS